ncbi:MAG: ABC transporter permease [Lachnospirales bacterium]
MRSKKIDWQLLLILSPGVIWLFMFCYIPMNGLRMAFYNYNAFAGFKGSIFIGFENFIRLFSGQDFPRAVKNTLVIGFLQLLISFPFAIFLALLITEMRSKWLPKIAQTVTFLPYFVSTVVAVSIAISFLSPSTGVINLILNKLGFESIYFIVEPKYFRATYIILAIWKSAGFNAVIYIAALMGIDPTFYECADVEGASRLQRIRYITLPSISHTVSIMLILQLGNIIKVGYETILLLYQPSTYSVADVISTYTYRLGMVQNNFGLATAAGLFESVVSLLLIVMANKISRKMSTTSVW